MPENWQKPTERKISLAVAVIKSHVKTKNEPVVFIQGGPEANTLEGISFWTNHALRKNHDIILMDLRGTGFSEPKLCPDLGKKFFQILSKNQSDQQDVQDKVKVSLECRQDMIDKGIDINSYNSASVAKDLHTLKNQLNIAKWNVYGVSYGTFISQNYAKTYPGDIQTLTLDSSIPDISEYYTSNTQNYISGLKKIFKNCKENPQCDKEYPNLENVYYNNISELEKNPITVNVDPSVVPSGKFTYNSEDYKIAIQQSLYSRKLVEVLPLLIYQFKERNTTTLAALLQAFSGALSLNYGNYFCFTCNEVIPFNNIQKYDSISSVYKKLNGGLSFYKSDFNVCDAWKKDQPSSVQPVSLKNLNNFKVLILSGSFDPITPESFGEKTLQNFNQGNAELIKGYTFGHTLGYTKPGAEMISNFIDGKHVDASVKKSFDQKFANFRTDIALHEGVVKMTGSINSKQWHYFIPLIISLLVLIVVFIWSLVKIFSKKEKTNGVVILLSVTSLLLLSFIISLSLAVNSTMNDNFFLLAFGLPSSWNFIFILYKMTLLFSLITLIVTLFKEFKNNIPLFLMIFLALGIIHYYFITWMFLSL